jgi:hypothetical protein
MISSNELDFMKNIVAIKDIPFIMMILLYENLAME